MKSDGNRLKIDNVKENNTPIGGIKNFWNEFSRYRALKNEKGRESPGINGARFNSKWTRRELDLAKRINNDMASICLIALVFIVPGGGFLIAAVLLKFPKYLTSHFWSAEIRDDKVFDDFAAKQAAQANIRLLWNNLESSMVIPDERGDWLRIFDRKENSCLLRWLGVYYGVVQARLNASIPFIFEGYAASRMIGELVDDRVNEILDDDRLLLEEDDVIALGRWELQRACTDRLLCRPTLSNSEMQAHLESWILLDSSDRTRKLRRPLQTVA